MKITTEGRLLRLLLAEIFFLAAFFWVGGILQIIFYIIGIIFLMHAAAGISWFYKLIKKRNNGRRKKRLNIPVTIFLIILLFAAPLAGGYYSYIFSRKFFLNDFSSINSLYRQTLYATSQNERASSERSYNKFHEEFTKFSQKYTNYHPFILKTDAGLDNDLQRVSGILDDTKYKIYSGDLIQANLQMQQVGDIFQNILERDGLQTLDLAFFEFNDELGKLINSAGLKDAQGIIDEYPIADSKLKIIESMENTGNIKDVRKNLNDLLEIAKADRTSQMLTKADDLRKSFLKAYLNP